MKSIHLLKSEGEIEEYYYDRYTLKIANNNVAAALTNTDKYRYLNFFRL